MAVGNVEVSRGVKYWLCKQDTMVSSRKGERATLKTSNNWHFPSKVTFRELHEVLGINIDSEHGLHVEPGKKALSVRLWAIMVYCLIIILISFPVVNDGNYSPNTLHRIGTGEAQAQSASDGASYSYSLATVSSDDSFNDPQLLHISGLSKSIETRLTSTRPRSYLAAWRHTAQYLSSMLLSVIDSCLLLMEEIQARVSLFSMESAVIVDKRCNCSECMKICI